MKTALSSILIFLAAVAGTLIVLSFMELVSYYFIFTTMLDLFPKGMQ